MNKSLKLLFLFFILVLPLRLSAQHVTERTNAVAGAGLNLWVSVRDSLTLAPVYGAAVTLSNARGKQTAETSGGGLASFEHRFGIKDSLLVQVHLLGYKDVSERILLHSNNAWLDVSMVESSDTLAALIFKEDALLMVSKGDTIVYNTALLGAREGDTLRELLKALPGITVEGNNVTADGRPVNKILVNGNVLFGNRLEPALKLIYGTDVKEIRVYDEHDQDRALAADTLGVKDHVLDVRTKKPMESIQGLYLHGKVGFFPDRTYRRQDQGIYGLGVDISSFAVDKPRLEIAARRSRNATPFAQSDTYNTPEADGSGNVDFRKSFGNKDVLSIRTSVESKSRTDGTYKETEYLPTSFFYGTGYAIDSEKTKKDLNGHADVSYRQLLNESMSLSYRAYGRVEREVDAATELTRFISGGLSEHQRDIHRYDRDVALYGGGTVSLSRATSKGKFSVDVNLSYGHSRMDGSKTDTLQTSPGVLMDADGEGSTLSPSVSISLNRKLSKNLLLRAWGSVRYSSSDKEYLAQNLITALTDTINTYRLLEKSFIANPKVYLEFRKPTDPFYCNGGLIFNCERVELSDLFPDAITGKHEIARLYPSLEMGFNIPSLKGKLSYSQSGSLPSPSMLRSRIDNSSTIYLTTGNPGLNAPREHSLYAQLNFLSFAAALTVSADSRYTIEEDHIINELVPLTEDTFLPEYRYSATTGSILSRPVNAGCYHTLRNQLLIDKAILPMKGKADILAVHTLSSEPYVIQESSGRNVNNNLMLNLQISGKTPSWLEYTLQYQPAWNAYRNMDYGRIRDFRQDVRMSVTARVFGHADVNMSGSYIINKSEAGLDYSYFKPDISLSYRFGENLSRSFSIVFSDFLNKTVSEKFTITDESLNRIYSRIMSRSILFSFNIRFKERTMPLR